MNGATGRVALVGAGPGDPELLTLRAVRRLAAAELVLYDALVDARVLELAPQARRFCVGKRAGRASVSQATIHRLMIGGARRGLRVVRLKCGDPFVLGRGGEELLALRAAGVPCEIVPGLTTAVVAAELAGIPVTQRGLSSSFVVVSGHEPRAYRPVLESLAAGASTLVVLMGLRTRAELASLLLARGWHAATPAAVCLAAGSAAARTWIGRLDALGQASLAGNADPGTIVIGDVVRLAHDVHAALQRPTGRDGGRPDAVIQRPTGRDGGRRISAAAETVRRDGEAAAAPSDDRDEGRLPAALGA